MRIYRHRRVFFCVHCGRTRRRKGGIYCCCMPTAEQIRKNKNPNRCPMCHLAYTD